MLHSASTGESETVSTRSRHILHETGRLHEAGGLGEPIVCAESTFERSNEHYLKTCSVPPISEPFGITSVGAITYHRFRICLHAFLNDAFRYFRNLFKKSQRAIRQSTITYGIPVVLSCIEPGMTGVLCRVEAFRDDCFAHYPAGVGLQRIVQPVITDSQCHYHLTHIQEMSGVPVGETTDGQHLLFRTVSIFLISRHTVSV